MIQRESNDLPFSVFIPTYNSAQYLGKRFSLSKIRIKNCFYVYHYGGSTDNTLQIAQRSNDLNMTIELSQMPRLLSQYKKI